MEFRLILGFNSGASEALGYSSQGQLTELGERKVKQAMEALGLTFVGQGCGHEEPYDPAENRWAAENDDDGGEGY